MHQQNDRSQDLIIGGTIVTVAALIVTAITMYPVARAIGTILLRIADQALTPH